MPENKIWKVIDIINWGKEYLSEKKISDPRLNIELLLCKIINCRRLDLYLNFDKSLTQNELSDFKILLKRRLNFEPLQYILGEIEFMGIRFLLNSYVLIPRPETEILVEECVNNCKRYFQNYKKISILDIGTGSGNISISLAKLISNSHITAIDINENILDLAKENARINSVEDKIEFQILNILETTLPDNWHFDIIISNPPYINIQEYDLLEPELKIFEPKNSLTDFSDGLTFYKRISEISTSILNDRSFIALEIAFNQGDSVKNIFIETGFTNIKVIKDYAGLDRIIIASHIVESLDVDSFNT